MCKRCGVRYRFNTTETQKHRKGILLTDAVGQHVEIARWNFDWVTGSADVGGGVVLWFLRVVRGVG